MSIPIRAADGCMVGSRLNRHDSPPFYLRLGASTEHTVEQCPQHTLHRTETEIKTPWGRVIGKLVKHVRGGTYLQIVAHKDRNYFIGKDVYCEEHKQWHFPGLS